MRIEQLESFVAVFDKGSMHKAAEPLHTSAQNVSQQIRLLERELGAQLFARNSYGVFPTADGEFLYAQAKDVLEKIDNIEQYFHRLESKATAREAVGNCNFLTAHSSKRIAYQLFESICTTFAVETATFIANDAAEVNHLLESDPSACFNNYEFVFTHFTAEEFARFLPLCKTYEAYELDRIRLGVHVSVNNAVANRETVSIRDMLDQALIANRSEGDAAPNVASALTNLGINIKPKYLFNSSVTTKQYVESNKGYGILPCPSNIERTVQPGGTVIIPLKERIFLRQVMFIGPQLRDSRVAEQALSVVRKESEHMDRIV